MLLPAIRVQAYDKPWVNVHSLALYANLRVTPVDPNLNPTLPPGTPKLTHQKPQAQSNTEQYPPFQQTRPAVQADCCSSLFCVAAEVASTSLLSNPKTLSTIQKILEGQPLGSESAVTDCAPGDGVGPLSGGDAEEEGQLVEVKFRATKPGKYSLQLICMSGTCVAA